MGDVRGRIAEIIDMLCPHETEHDAVEPWMRVAADRILAALDTEAEPGRLYWHTDPGHPCPTCGHVPVPLAEPVAWRYRVVAREGAPANRWHFSQKREWADEVMSRPDIYEIEAVYTHPARVETNSPEDLKRRSEELIEPRSGSTAPSTRRSEDR